MGSGSGGGNVLPPAPVAHGRARHFPPGLLGQTPTNARFMENRCGAGAGVKLLCLPIADQINERWQASLRGKTWNQ